jgi:hypothetical protein
LCLAFLKPLPYRGFSYSSLLNKPLLFCLKKKKRKEKKRKGGREEGRKERKKFVVLHF